MTGVDFSPRSIQYARQAAEQEGLSIRYVHQNYLEYETEERYDLITMITCDFCALSPAQRRQILVKWARLLRPGGHVLLDAYLPAAFAQYEETARYAPQPGRRVLVSNPYYEFVNTFKYEQDQVVLDKITIVEADRVRTVYNWLAWFDARADQARIRRLRARGDRGLCRRRRRARTTRKQASLRSWPPRPSRLWT